MGRSSWLLALGLVVALPVAAFGDGLYLYRVPVNPETGQPLRNRSLDIVSHRLNHTVDFHHLSHSSSRAQCRHTGGPSPYALAPRRFWMK